MFARFSHSLRSNAWQPRRLLWGTICLLCVACQSALPVATAPTPAPHCDDATPWPVFLPGTADIPTYPCMFHAIHLARSDPPTSIGSGHVLSFTTSDPQPQILTTYRHRLLQAGWQIATNTAGAAASLTVEKDAVVFGPQNGFRRSVQVTVTPQTEQLRFVIVVEYLTLAVYVHSGARNPSTVVGTPYNEELGTSQGTPQTVDHA